MSSIISDKIAFIKKAKYSYFLIEKVHPIINLSTFLFFSIIFSSIFLPAEFFNYTNHGLKLFSMIVVFGYVMVSFDSFEKFKLNIFSYLFKKRKIKKEIESEFGSVENAIKLYNDLENMGIELSDENIYNLINENIKDKNRRHIVRDRISSRIDKIDERINKLLKEKEKVYSSGKVKEQGLFDKNLKMIENKTNDISIDASELKDRVLSTVGGLI